MPLGLILTFLKGNWKVIAGAMVIIAALWYVQNLRVQVANQATKIVQLTDDNKTLTDNNKILVDAINTSNTALEATNKAALDAASDFDTIQHKLLQQTANLNQRLSMILHSKTPETCQAAIDYLILNAKEYAKPNGVAPDVPKRPTGALTVPHTITASAVVNVAKYTTQEQAPLIHQDLTYIVPISSHDTLQWVNLSVTQLDPPPINGVGNKFERGE